MMLLLKLSWRNIWRHRRRTLITISAMAVGVGFCMAVIALNAGVYSQGFDVVVRQSMGHIQIHAPGFPEQRSVHQTIDAAAEILRQLDALPEVTGSSARTFGFALLAAKDKATGVQLTGIDPRREPRVTSVHERITTGRYLSLTPNHEIMLGVELAKSLTVGVGEEVVAVTQSADGSLGNEIYQVVGLFRTGSAMLDRAGALLHEADVQALLALEGRVHEIAVAGRERGGIEALAARLKAELGGGNRENPAGQKLLIRTWAEVNPVLAKILAVQDAGAWIILLIVFAVAALGVLNTMLMSVFERTRELGLMRSLGFQPAQIINLVLCETAILAGFAALAGGALGLLLDAYLVYHGLDLSRYTEGFSFSGIFFEPVIRGVVEPKGVIQTMVAVFVVALFAALWPAVQAARLKPVVAMRAE